MEDFFHVDKFLHQVGGQQVAALDLVGRVDFEDAFEFRVFEHGPLQAVAATEPVEEAGIPRHQRAAMERLVEGEAQALTAKHRDPAGLRAALGIG